MKRRGRLRSAVLCAAAASVCLLGSSLPAPAESADKAAAVRHYLAGADAAAAGRRDAAVREYLAGEAADPTYALNYFALTDLAVQSRDYAAAQSQLQRLLVLRPSTPYAHYYLALVLEAQHQNEAALEHINAELQINPSYAPAKRARNELLAVLGATAQPAQPAPATTAATARPALHPAVKVTARATPGFRNFPVPTPRPTPTPSATPLPTPSPTPFMLTSAMTEDAKGYLLEIARDVAFTQALPPAGSAQDPHTVERTIAANLGRHGSYDALLSSGSAALVGGRVQLAHQAFDSASQKRPGEWRPVYLEGLSAQADRDLQPARALFVTALQRARRPEILTSLAIVDLRLNDPVRAASEAQSAAALDAAYQPAQLTAGLIALAAGDAATASRRLQDAVALGHAPERAPLFLDLAQRAAAQ